MICREGDENRKLEGDVAIKKKDGTEKNREQERERDNEARWRQV